MTEWFRQLALREQIVLAAGTGLAVLIIAWQFLWTPLVGDVDGLRESVDERSRLVVDLRRAANAAPTAGGPATDGLQSPMMIVEQTARSAGLPDFAQTRMEGSDTIRLTVRGAAFVSLVDWLVMIERQHGLRATSVDLSRAGTGLVDGQLVLSRG